MSDFDAAHAAAAAAMDVAEEIDSDHYRAVALAARAKASRHLERYEEAIVDDVNAAEAFNLLVQWEREVHCRLDASGSALELEMYQEALEQAEIALAIATGMADPYLIGRSSLRAAQALRHLDQPRGVLEHAGQARALLHGEANLQSLACDLIADAWIDLEDPAAALYFLEQSMHIMEAVRGGEPPLWERWHFAKGLRLAGRLAEAQEMLEETIDLLHENNPRLDALGNCYLELARVLHELGEEDAPADLLRKASMLLEVSGSQAAIDECQLQLREWAA
jgi:tetratricopeptide (TPR) repeat protein